MWDFDGAVHADGEYAGRRCVTVSAVSRACLVRPVATQVRDGVLEAELALDGERSFHGVFWRRTERAYESFYVRPHQSGNPDSLQYSPVFNDVASWQLHHGEGFWNAIDVPVREWFTVRVAFEGERAATWVNGDLVLVSRLRVPVGPGGAGIYVGGENLHIASFEVEERSGLALPAPPPETEAPAGTVRVWRVSEPFAESELPERLDAQLERAAWTELDAEPSGLVNLARLHGIAGGRNTVYAATTLESDGKRRVPLELGFSDRAVVFLNGERLYRGDDGYRSRDYRFLGSIGWYDTVYLPLRSGRNDLVVAVSEDFGGWGVQARIAGEGVTTV